MDDTKHPIDEAQPPPDDAPPTGEPASRPWQLGPLGRLAVDELKALAGITDSQAEPFTDQPLARVFTPDNPLQAEYLVDVLAEEGVPAIFHSFRDTALDGIFQGQWGSGVIITREQDAHKALTIIEAVVRTIELEATKQLEDEPEE
ncbi:MAG: hypothetical protein FJ109_11945 [Deltaproteobacteria bacterium]|nr:hypothetical protein [Deltaproteobacteria bacterium]